MTRYFRSTLYVDSRGNAMTNRVFFIHAAVEEMQTTGYLCEQTLQSLSRDEYVLVMERARTKDIN